MPILYNTSNAILSPFTLDYIFYIFLSFFRVYAVASLFFLFANKNIKGKYIISKGMLI